MKSTNLRIKTLKSFIHILKDLGENTLISELKGAQKLTEDEQSMLRTIIAGIQNDLGDIPAEFWEKINIQPYSSQA